MDANENPPPAPPVRPMPPLAPTPLVPPVPIVPPAPPSPAALRSGMFGRWVGALLCGDRCLSRRSGLRLLPPRGVWAVLWDEATCWAERCPCSDDWCEEFC
jgi:hypothetical protein